MLFPEDLRSDTEIANEFPVLFKTVLAEKMEPESRIRGDEGSVEYRVQVPSKRRVIDQIDRYQQVIKRVLDGQEDVGPDTRRMLLQELLAVRHAVSMMLTGSRTHRHNTGRGLCDLRQSFEAGVQENVLVDGRPWDEAPDVEELESLLDDAIVDTSWRRRCYPRQILPHVIHALKAERKLMVRLTGSHFLQGVSQSGRSKGEGQEACASIHFPPNHNPSIIHPPSAPCSLFQWKQRSCLSTTSNLHHTPIILIKRPS
ncbi:kinetochore-associated protein NSL1 homolog isoform X3 [Antennarius striatus]|uniref:kinetochore-associated protein NSL1 homolog isoform X3 n=1 Tax=Antennarius striatus TaxID=241820 RepID=UPI0035AF1A31